MNEQPDKLFQERLVNYQPAVSTEAWKRVSENLDRKSTPTFWLSIAAVFLLLAVAGILLLPQHQDASSTLVAKKDAPKQEPTQAADQPNAAKIYPDGKQTTPSSSAPEAGTKRASATRKKSLTPVSPAETVVQPDEHPLAAKEITPNSDEESERGDLTATNEVSASAQESERQHVTIVFSASEVDEKYLMKKSADSEATPEEEDTSRWQKLLDKAYDLKHNQDPLGNLRQKKNEVLALNFRNNQSHENK